MVTPSTPGAPRFARTSPQALASTSLRPTLSYRAWKRRLGSCLALRYSTSCKARDFSSLSALLGDLALIGHSPDPLLVRACAGEAGALRSGRVVLSRPSSLLRPPPTPSRPSATSRALVIGGPASRAADPGPRRPLQFPRHPSDRSTPHAPGGSCAPAPGSLVPSVAFANPSQARLPLDPARTGVLVTTVK